MLHADTSAVRALVVNENCLRDPFQYVTNILIQGTPYLSMYSTTRFKHSQHRNNYDELHIRFNRLLWICHIHIPRTGKCLLSWCNEVSYSKRRIEKSTNLRCPDDDAGVHSEYAWMRTMQFRGTVCINLLILVCLMWSDDYAFRTRYYYGSSYQAVDMHKYWFCNDSCVSSITTFDTLFLLLV